MEKLAEAFQQGFDDACKQGMEKEAVDPFLGGGLAALGIGAKGTYDAMNLLGNIDEWDQAMQQSLEGAAAPTLNPNFASSVKSVAADSPDPQASRVAAQAVGGLEGANVQEALGAYARKAGQASRTPVLGIPAARFAEMGAKVKNAIPERLKKRFLGSSVTLPAGGAEQHYDTFLRGSVGERMAQLQEERLGWLGEGKQNVIDMPDRITQQIRDPGVSINRIIDSMDEAGLGDLASRSKAFMSTMPGQLAQLPKAYGRWAQKGTQALGGLAGLGALSTGYGLYRQMGNNTDKATQSTVKSLGDSLGNISPRSLGAAGGIGAGALGLSELTGLTDVI